MDSGEYDVDVVVNPTNKGKEDLAEAIEAQGDKTWSMQQSLQRHTEKRGLKVVNQPTTIGII